MMISLILLLIILLIMKIIIIIHTTITMTIMIVIYFASVDRIYDVAYEEDDKQTQACSSEV